jgi:hypothetical protein
MQMYRFFRCWQNIFRWLRFSYLIKKSYFAANKALLMILSVIIVNYNAKFFLEQCLCSLCKALGFVEEKFPGRASEIILVDNHSRRVPNSLWLPALSINNDVNL